MVSLVKFSSNINLKSFLNLSVQLLLGHLLTRVSRTTFLETFLSAQVIEGLTCVLVVLSLNLDTSKICMTRNFGNSAPRKVVSKKAVVEHKKPL